MAFRSLAFAACLALCPAGLAVAADFDGGLIPPGHILLPDGPASAVVTLLSSPDGWSDGEAALAVPSGRRMWPGGIRPPSKSAATARPAAGSR